MLTMILLLIVPCCSLTTPITKSNFLDHLPRQSVIDLSGTITSKGGSPVSGARIIVKNKETEEKFTVYADKEGHYVATGLKVGEYEVSVEFSGYEAQTRSVNLTPDQASVLDVEILPIGSSSRGVIKGVVTDYNGKPLEGADVTIIDNSLSSTGTETDEKGYYEKSGLTPGIYTIRVEALGFHTKELKRKKVKPRASVKLDFKLSSK